MKLNDITGQIVDSAMRVHSALGPGLLESAYEACLIHELRKRGLRVLSQVEVHVEYDGIRIDVGYRIDLLVEGRCYRRVEGSRKNDSCSRSTALVLFEKIEQEKSGVADQFQRPSFKRRHQTHG